MHTGYTHKLMEHGQTFRQFALMCSRAFGALALMRDSPLSDDIPERFEVSGHHAKKMNAASEEIVRLRGMSDCEKVAYGVELRRGAIASAATSHEQSKLESARLAEMLEEVNAWQPPTSDHEGLKSFMIQQLGVSDSDQDFYAENLKQAENKSPVEYFAEATAGAEWNFDFHKAQLAKEIEGVNTRNAWIRQLSESLPLAPRKEASDA